MWNFEKYFKMCLSFFTITEHNIVVHFYRKSIKNSLNKTLIAFAFSDSLSMGGSGSKIAYVYSCYWSYANIDALRSLASRKNEKTVLLSKCKNRQCLQASGGGVEIPPKISGTTKVWLWNFYNMLVYISRYEIKDFLS